MKKSNLPFATNLQRICNYSCPIKAFQRKKSFLFHRIVDLPACQISDAIYGVRSEFAKSNKSSTFVPAKPKKEVWVSG